jgi:translation initiation factor RLI1
MNDGCCRILIEIDLIFIDILHDELVSFLGHPGVDKSEAALTRRSGTARDNSRCKIEQGIAV